MTKNSDSHFETLAAQSTQLREEAKDTALQQAYAEAERKLQAAAQRTQSIMDDEQRVIDIIPPGATREQLLDRIREMRNEKVEVVPDYYISPDQQAQIDLEQADGRAAVAKAEEEAQRIAKLREHAVVQIEKAGMTPVHHPNPSQQEQYPAIKATLGKLSGAPKQLK